MHSHHKAEAPGCSPAGYTCCSMNECRRRSSGCTRGEAPRPAVAPSLPAAAAAVRASPLPLPLALALALAPPQLQGPPLRQPQGQLLGQLQPLPLAEALVGALVTPSPLLLALPHVQVPPLRQPRPQAAGQPQPPALVADEGETLAGRLRSACSSAAAAAPAASRHCGLGFAYCSRGLPAAGGHGVHGGGG